MCLYVEFTYDIHAFAPLDCFNRYGDYQPLLACLHHIFKCVILMKSPTTIQCKILAR